MKETVIGIVKLLLCILMLIFAERYYFELLANIGLEVSNFTPLVRELMVLVLYALMFGVVYACFAHHIKPDFNNYSRKILPNVLMSVAFFAVLVIFVWMIDFLVASIANNAEIAYQGLNLSNIFNQEFDLIVLSSMIRSVILMPLMLCFIYVLGVYDLVDSKRSGVVLTGLLAAVITAVGMSGILTTILLNVIPTFALFFALAYIYHKNRHNIWFSAITFVLYGIFASLLIERIT